MPALSPHTRILFTPAGTANAIAHSGVVQVSAINLTPRAGRVDYPISHGVITLR